MFHFAAFNSGPPSAIAHNIQRCNIISIQAQAAPTKREQFLTAFCDIIPRWQEAKENPRIGLHAIDYGQHAGRGSSSHSSCTALVGPCVADFVADVTLSARRALSPKQQAYFFEYYGARCQRLDEVPAEYREIDDAAREKLGRRLVEVEIFPLHFYMRKVDVRVPKDGVAAKPAIIVASNFKVVRLPVVPVVERFAGIERCTICNGTLRNGQNSPCCDGREINELHRQFVLAERPRYFAEIKKKDAAQPGTLDTLQGAAELERRYFTCEQAAEYLGGLNPRTVARWAREGYIPSIPIGEGKRRLWRFVQADLDEWMSSRKQGGEIAA